LITESVSTYREKHILNFTRLQFLYNDTNSLEKDSGDPLPKENRYRELVGGILYLANTVRPDLLFAAGLLARFFNAPCSTHLSAGMNVLKYLAGTTDMGLVWEKGSKTFEAFVDSDYAGDLDGRKSTSGFVFMSGSAAVSWGSKLQPHVALSTVEAEFISVSYWSAGGTLVCKVDY
jgi:hypothetical protein